MSEITQLRASIISNLGQLLSQYGKDTGAAIRLAEALSQMVNAISPISLNDVSELLHQVTNSIGDNNVLVAEVNILRNEVQQLKAKLESKETHLAVRQIYHAVNEKLLRKLIELVGLPAKAFWQKYKISDIGQVVHHRDLGQVWPAVQQQFQFSESPAELWDMIASGKHEFDRFVHESSFPHFSYQELQSTVAPSVFDGDLEKYEAAFLHVLDLDQRLTAGTDKDLYTY